MRLGVLFSGGKDSNYALLKALEYESVSCLISLVSENKESYMFHTPNIDLVEMQAKAIGIPLVKENTLGEKESELKDLGRAIERAMQEYGIEGVVSGAIDSVYQAERVQRICFEKGLWCFNPLWLREQEELVREVIARGFKTIISGVYAYPFSREWVGRELDSSALEELVLFKEKYGISPSGEGGELETTVLDAPFYKKKIVISDFAVEGSNNSWVMRVKEAGLVGK